MWRGSNPILLVHWQVQTRTDFVFKIKLNVFGLLWSCLYFYKQCLQTIVKKQSYKMLFFAMRINNFRCDVTSTSSRTQTLHTRQVFPNCTPSECACLCSECMAHWSVTMPAVVRVTAISCDCELCCSVITLDPGFVSQIRLQQNYIHLQVSVACNLVQNTRTCFTHDS